MKLFRQYMICSEVVGSFFSFEKIDLYLTISGQLGIPFIKIFIENISESKDSPQNFYQIEKNNHSLQIQDSQQGLDLHNDGYEDEISILQLREENNKLKQELSLIQQKNSNETPCTLR